MRSVPPETPDFHSSTFGVWCCPYRYHRVSCGAPDYLSLSLSLSLSRSRVLATSGLEVGGRYIFFALRVCRCSLILPSDYLFWISRIFAGR